MLFAGLDFVTSYEATLQQQCYKMLEDVVTFPELSDGQFECGFWVDGNQRLEMVIQDRDDAAVSFGSG
jgi:hypothetical protein